jgi:hypothetical protein
MSETRALALTRPAEFETNLMLDELERRARERRQANQQRENYRTHAVGHMRRLRGFPQFGVMQPLGWRRSTDNRPILELTPDETAQLGATPTHYDPHLMHEQSKLATMLTLELEHLWLQVYALTSASATRTPEPDARDLREASAEWREWAEQQRAAFDTHHPRNDGEQWQPRRWPPKNFALFEDMHRFIAEERVHLATARRGRQLDSPPTMELHATVEQT